MPLTAFLLFAAIAAAAPAVPAAPKRIAFKTDDGWTIAADYRAPRRGGDVVILAHGVGSAKGEWSRLTSALAARGVGTLAVDLRGHADSRRGPGGIERGYETFDASGEWPRAVGDVLAAAGWLRARGVSSGRIAFGGASIGANLAAAAAARLHCRTFVVLLSPGVDYRGVELVLPAQAKILIGSAPGDAYADATRRDAAKYPNVETFSAPAGHGVQMFDDPATLARVADWIAAQAAVLAPERTRP
ncbi:MAG: alpha/beta fold hydrolase [Elusimicrobia bacterium]|nr:alpha/beta fold hydrolase [Elusimicrobiota bacterium]